MYSKIWSRCIATAAALMLLPMLSMAQISVGLSVNIAPPELPVYVQPPIPADGFHSEEEIAHLPGAELIDFAGTPGPSRSTYAFLRATTQRNLYRVPIP